MSYGSILILQHIIFVLLATTIIFVPPASPPPYHREVVITLPAGQIGQIAGLPLCTRRAIFAANLAGCKTGQSAGICNKKNISRIICWQAEGRFWEHSLLKKKQYLEWYMRASHGRLWE